MRFQRVFQCFAVAVALTAWSGISVASSDLVEKVQNNLYAGKTAAAAAAAQDRLAGAPDDNQARFALGVVQFIQAIEGFGQALHRYGLRTSNGRDLGLPFQNIPVPENPDPEKMTYEAIREILATFVADLKTAERTLGRVGNGAIDFPINIGLIRLDLDSDGETSDEEVFWRIFKAVAGFPWLDEERAGQLLIDFDESDVPWLRGYSNLLMAVAEFMRAHDWQVAFETTFHGLFPKAGLPFGLAERDAEAVAELTELGLPSEIPGEDWTALNERYQQWRDSLDGNTLQRVRKLQRQDRYAFYLDIIAFIHLINWPVVAPERLKNVLGHLEAVVQLSRENWRQINAETDDRNEWLPNARQSGALPRMQVTEDRVAAWLRLLDESDALLQGEKMIPHWRFDQGINLRRILLEPTTFDIVLLLQGSAALPYLEDGDLVTMDTWREITRAFDRSFFRYFIWFN